MASPRTPRKSAYDPIKKQITSHKTLERKALEFDFTIHDVSFNYSGTYFLKLSVNSSFTSDLSSLRVRSGRPIDGPTRGFHFGAEARTEVTDDLQQDQVYSLDDAIFSFYMPVGFNKNDIKHDVFLLIEAFIIDQNTAQSQRIGEARLPIYPRSDVEMNFDLEIGDPIYRLGGKSPIFRTNTQDALHMHCGSVSYTCQLIEAWPIEEEGDQLAPLPPPKPRQQPPPPAPQKQKKEPPVRMTPRGEPARALTIREDPDTQHRSVDPLLGEYRLVAPAGKEEVTIIVHGGNDVRNHSAHRLPRLFVTAQTKFDEDSGKSAQGVTHATVKATDNPSWEEMLTVTMDANRAPDEVVVIKVGDRDSKEIIQEFRIPVGTLQPFHHYHLNMHKFNTEQGKVFASATRKQDSLPDPGNALTFRALEACLIGVRQPLQNPAGALICVAKIVSDYYNFVNQLLAYRNSGLELTTAQFPNPHPTTFFVSDRWTGQGQAQVTLPGRPVSRPQWHHPFLFCDQRELATLFTVGAALVVEFYDFNNAAVNETEWRSTKPVGYSALVLDSRAYRQLCAAGADKGVAVELPLQGGQLRSSDGRLPAVQLLLRLHNESSPANQSQATLSSSVSGFVQLQPTHIEVPREDFVDEEGSARDPAAAAAPGAAAADGPRAEWEWDPYRDLALLAKGKRKRDKQPITDGELPSETAVQSVLPELNYIFPAPPTHRRAPAQRQQQQQQQQQPMLADATGQIQQLQRYKEALRHMGQDILSLRDRIAELKRENQGLKQDLIAHTDTRYLLSERADLDTTDKSELISRYASLKNNLISSSSDLAQYKEKLQQLQRRMQQQQQQHSGLQQLTDSHAAQQPVLQQLQAKAAKLKKLEAACEKQRQVMDRMQRVLAATKPQAAHTGDTMAKALAEENRRLREEVSLLGEGRSERRQHGDAGGGRIGEAERVQLYQLLDTADTRIAVLQRQVADKSRKWQTERQRLHDRLLAAKAKARR